MFNEVVILGQVGNILVKDKFSKLSVATQKFKPATKEKETHWHDCMIFGKTKEFVDNFVKKGSKVFLTGELQYTVVKDELTGKSNKFSNILVRAFKLLDKKEETPDNIGNQIHDDFNEDELPF